MLIPAVDVLRCDQLLDAVQVPLLGGFQESRVSPKEVGNVTVRLFHHVQWDQVITVATVYVSTMLCMCVCVCVCWGKGKSANNPKGDQEPCPT